MRRGLPEFANSAHSCRQHGPDAAWLTSEWPGSVIAVPKTFKSLVNKSHCDTGSRYQTDGTVDKVRALRITLLEFPDTQLSTIV